jgi:hypothetical protein
MPAISYCFSTIDLLGALAAGNASKSAKTVEQSKTYMLDLMAYSEENASLLQRVFRHKVVHLAIPRPVIIDQQRQLSWRYLHDDPNEHLTVKLLTGSVPGPTEQIPISHEFTLSIATFEEDIRRSATGANGYLARLQQDNVLQSNFQMAIGQIFDPTP